MKFKIIFSAIAIITVLIIVYALSGGSQIKPELPEFARKTARVTEAYIYAVQNPDKVMYYR